MTKDSAVWVLIRGFGLYLIIHTIFLLPNMIPAILTYYSMNENGIFYVNEISNPANRVYFNLLLQIFLQVAFYVGLGVYFLFWGKALHRLIKIPDACEQAIPVREECESE